jgi:hypothetical protein
MLLTLTHNLGLVGQLVALFLEISCLELALSDLLLDVVGEASELVSDHSIHLLLIEVDEGADLRETQLHTLFLDSQILL